MFFFCIFWFRVLDFLMIHAGLMLHLLVLVMVLSFWEIQKFLVNNRYGMGYWLIIRYPLCYPIILLQIVNLVFLLLNVNFALAFLYRNCTYFLNGIPVYPLRSWHFHNLRFFSFYSEQEHECLVEGSLNNLKQSMVQFQKPKKVWHNSVPSPSVFYDSVQLRIVGNLFINLWFVLCRYTTTEGFSSVVDLVL